MLNKAAILVVRSYRFVWHPLLAGLEAAGVVLNRCRLEPTCSDYALAALEENPFKNAVKLISARLRMCHKSGKNGMKGG